MVTEAMAGEQELLSLEDAAELLCVSKSTLYRRWTSASWPG